MGQTNIKENDSESLRNKNNLNYDLTESKKNY